MVTRSHGFPGPHRGHRVGRAAVTLFRVSGGVAVGGVGTGLTVVGVVLAVAGIALGVVGVLGWRRRLPRNRFAGVRTTATLRDDETFAVGNQVSAPLTTTAGAVALVAGVAAVFAPSPLAGGVVAGLGLLGVLGLAVVGGVIGDRAAGLVPQVSAPGGCTGVCTGCSLVEGCGGGSSGAAGGGGSSGADGGGSSGAAGGLGAAEAGDGGSTAATRVP